MAPVDFPLNSNKPVISVDDRGSYYFLLYNSPPDNRYTSDFIDAYLEALTYLRTVKASDPKPLITSSAIPKFFSNGLDFEVAIRTENFFPDKYYRLMRAQLEFPWPTIALVNGHAFAAGFMIAACHDYRVMNPEKGFLCMNELLFGAPLLPPMMSIFKVKFGTQLAQKIALTAHRFTAKEALKVGLIDATGGLAEAEQIASMVFKLAQSPVYSDIRKELLKDVIQDTRTFHEDGELKAKNLEEELGYYEALAKQLKLSPTSSKL